MTAEQRPATALERAVREIVSTEWPVITLGPSIAYAVVPVSAIGDLRQSIDPERPAPRPFVAFDPAMRGGQATIGGTGLTVESMAERIWAGMPAEELLRDWDYLTRGDLIVACWWTGIYGQPSWQWRWGAWAQGVAGQLHRAQSAEDFEAIVWPPVAGEG